MGFSRRQDRREERREDRGPGDRTDGDHRYKMRQKVLAIGDDFWIENGRGEKVYKIDGKALRVRQTLIFEDRNGNELLKIQERMLRVKDSMEIEDPYSRRERSGSAGQYPRSRIPHRQRGRGVEEVVSYRRQLRHRD